MPNFKLLKEILEENKFTEEKICQSNKDISENKINLNRFSNKIEKFKESINFTINKNY